jgi:ornithine carbamoyltransferase
MRGRDFLSLQDYDQKQIWKILRLARELKRKRIRKLLPNKSLAIIFQKPSTRTSPASALRRSEKSLV